MQKKAPPQRSLKTLRAFVPEETWTQFAIESQDGESCFGKQLEQLEQSQFQVGSRSTFEMYRGLTNEWAGRRYTLDASIVSTTLDQLKDTPAFVADLLAFLASNWSMRTAVWAPHRSWTTWTATCRRCGTEIFWSNNDEEEGQVRDPFGFDNHRGWCRDCGKLDMIPWREGEANDH